MFGRDALELVEGRLGFGVEKGRLKMTRIDRAAQAEAEAAALRPLDDEDDGPGFQPIDEGEDQAAQ